MPRVTMTKAYRKAYEKGKSDSESGAPYAPPFDESDAYTRGYKGLEPEHFKHITGRPSIAKSGESESIRFRVCKTDAAALQVLVETSGLTQSAYLRNLVREHLRSKIIKNNKWLSRRL